MQIVISNIESLKKLKDLNNKEKNIMQTYFANGGLLKSLNDKKLKIIYPSKEIIKKEHTKLKEKLKKIEQELKKWKDKKKEAENFSKK